jgi:hypothetical protein
MKSYKNDYLEKRKVKYFSMKIPKVEFVEGEDAWCQKTGWNGRECQNDACETRCGKIFHFFPMICLAITHTMCVVRNGNLCTSAAEFGPLYCYCFFSKLKSLTCSTVQARATPIKFTHLSSQPTGPNAALPRESRIEHTLSLLSPLSIMRRSKAIALPL